MRQTRVWGRTLAGLAFLTASWFTPAGALAQTSRASGVSGSERLQLVLPLVSDDAGLARFAQAVTTPGTPEYGQYRSIAWLSRHFGAPPGARRRAAAYLRAAGATDVRVDTTGLFIDARVPAGVAQRLFHTRLRVMHATRGGPYTAPVAPVRIPRPLRGTVTGVVGLDTRAVASSPAADVPSSGYEPATGRSRGCSRGISAGGFSPNQYLTAYGFDPLRAGGELGQGERVALVELNGYRAADIRTFASCFGLGRPRISRFEVGIRHAMAPGVEATLDLEILDAAAPDLKSIDVYESQPAASSVVMAMTAPMRSGRRKPQVISVSLGLCERQNVQALGRPTINALERALEEAAASGITVMAATGDFGASECLPRLGGNMPIHRLDVFFPASSPWVTAVGGTNLVLNPDNTIRSQQVWNDGGLQPGAAAGGGFSWLFPRPAYQDGVVLPNQRALPDVALLADIAPGYDIYCSIKPDCVNDVAPNPWQTVGGTSAATPLFAGAVALADQALRQMQRQDLGGLNPLLYQLGAQPAEAATVFDDVTVGDNDISQFFGESPLGCCAAGPGFDEATGWGGVNVSALAGAAQLSQPPQVTVGLTVGPQQPVRSHGIVATVSCSAACRLGAFARVTIGHHKPFADFSRLQRLIGAGSLTVRIPLAPKQLKRLRSALRHGLSITARVFGASADYLGNIERQSAPAVLPIKG